MNKLKPSKKLVRVAVILPFILLTVLLYLYLLFFGFYNHKIYPGVKVGSLLVGSLSVEDAKEMIDKEFQYRSGDILTLTYQNQKFNIRLADSAPKLDTEQPMTKAYAIGRSGNLITDLKDQLYLLIHGQTITPSLTYKNQASLMSQVASINQAIKKDAVNARLEFGDPITVIPSSNGQEVNEQQLLTQLEQYLSLKTDRPIEVPVQIQIPKFSTSTAQAAQVALEKVKISPIRLQYEKEEWLIDQNTLLSLLDLNTAKPNLVVIYTPTGKIEIDQLIVGKETLTDSQLVFDKEKLNNYLKSIAEKINQPVEEGRFVFDPQTKRVKEFKAAQDGRQLKTESVMEDIVKALHGELSSDIVLAVEITKPTVTTDAVNSYGIKELIGRGVSHFSGSITNRIYNLSLATSRINGVLIAPNETFSFNQAVGDISSDTGYRPAYVIKSGKTVLDDGGGVCQVSTTIYRTVLNSGLPIVQRLPHSYRVGYYEQGFPPGLDATVFPPYVDFKFKNDTPSHILVQAYIKGNTVYIDFYGTDDGRVVNLTTPKITNQTPPPPEIRQDDPTLPKGTIKQVEQPAWGANIVFHRTVTRDGQTLIQETINTNYQSWAAVYLVGTQE